MLGSRARSSGSMPCRTVTSARAQPWQPPYGTAGAVQNKATDASGAAAMTFTAAAGHACGMDFKAADHVKAHPEFMWQKDLQRDMRAYTWTSFTVAK